MALLRLALTFSSGTRRRHRAAPGKGLVLGAVALAGILAAAALLSPAITVDGNGNFRAVLSGVQIQRASQTFVAGGESLIHFHGLDGREGQLEFALSSRRGSAPNSIDVYVNGEKQTRDLQGDGDAMSIPIPTGTRDLDVHLVAESAAPRSIEISRVTLTRSMNARAVVVALVPVLAGLLVAYFAFQRDAFLSPVAGIVAVAVASFVMASAFDPVRIRVLRLSLVLSVVIAIVIACALVALRFRVSWLSGLMLAFAVIVTHVDAAHFGFVYDDRLWARPWTFAELASTFVGSEDPLEISGQQYRPVASISHALDYALFGASASMEHAVNIAWHAACVVLLMILLRRVLKSPSAAVLGAIAFALHPMAASSIGWISERTDSLMGAFLLLSLLPLVNSSQPRLAAVLVPALLSLWSKETAVMLALLAPALVFVVHGREGVWARRRVLGALVVIVLTFVLVWIAIFPVKAALRLESNDAGGNATVTSLWAQVFSQLVRPLGYEGWRAVRFDSTNDSLYLGVTAGVLVILTGAFAVTKRREWGLAAFGLLWPALVVLPFRGHDGVDIYRLGHSLAIGLGFFVAGIAALVPARARLVYPFVAAALVAAFVPPARAVTAAWGDPGFQFVAALRFNLDNPTFMAALTPEMRADIERAKAIAAHTEDPIAHDFPR